MKTAIKGRILVAEDELMVAMGLELVLARAGFEVVGPIGQFDQAVEAATNDDMDFALLDVNVRGAEIFPVADILTQRGIPFAFLTGYGKESLPANQKKAKILPKPFKIDDLLTALPGAHSETG